MEFSCFMSCLRPRFIYRFYIIKGNDKSLREIIVWNIFSSLLWSHVPEEYYLIILVWQNCTWKKENIRNWDVKNWPLKNITEEAFSDWNWSLCFLVLTHALFIQAILPTVDQQLTQECTYMPVWSVLRSAHLRYLLQLSGSLSISRFTSVHQPSK